MKIANIEVTLIDHMGSDLSVVNAARVSFDKESEWEHISIVEGEILKQSDAKLINYLAKHKHFSPFNHAFLSFRVKAPIFVARQLVKHKFMPWNEISRRYVDSEPEFYFPKYWREKGENVKQGSGEGHTPNSYIEVGYRCDYADVKKEVNERELTKYLLQMYKQKLQDGCCPEQARMVLPQNTMTEWYWSGSLGAFLDMLVLRLDPHTQKETRDVAVLIAEHVSKLFPVSYKARLN